MNIKIGIVTAALIRDFANVSPNHTGIIILSKPQANKKVILLLFASFIYERKETCIRCTRISKLDKGTAKRSAALVLF